MGVNVPYSLAMGRVPGGFTGLSFLLEPLLSSLFPPSICAVSLVLLRLNSEGVKNDHTYWV